MITLLKLLDGDWKKAKGFLRLDLDAIQSALNTHWSAVFNINNEILAAAVPGDSTIDSVYVSNQGAGHTPLWDKVNLANGVQGRLAFAHLVEATQPGVLVGRRSASAGDFEQITPGTGVAIHGTSLDVTAASLVASFPGSALVPQEPEPSWPQATPSASALFLAGSVIFAGPSGALAQDNTNFFWDDTNNFLGIGTSTPKNRIDVVGGGVRVQGTIAGATTGKGVEIQYTGGDEGVILAFDRLNGIYKPVSYVGSEVGLVATDGLKIYLSGNVGIGANFTPSWILHSKVLTNATSRWQQESTGTGQVSLQFTRSGGTASDWLVYLPSGSKNWHFYDTNGIGDSVIFQFGGMMSFQGVSASEPALKRSAAKLQVKLADDSDYASFDIGAFQTFNQSGVGNVGVNFIRTGGTALNWIFYGKPGTTSLALYNGSDRFTFDAAGKLTLTTADVDDHIEAGAGTVAASGVIRFANNTVGLTARNALNTGDVGVFTVDAADQAVIGFLNVNDIVFKPQNTEVARFVVGVGLRVKATGSIYFDAQSVFSSPANAQLNLTNFAGAAGIGFDVSTDTLLKIRTRAQTGYGTIDCLGLKASGTAGFNGTVGPVATITVVNGIVTNVA